MIRFIYSDEGKPINDFHAQKYITDLIARNTDEIRVVHVCNEPVLTAMVLAIVKKEIDPTQVEFFYFDKPMKFCPYVGLEDPDGVHEIGTNLSMTNEILNLGLKNIRAKHLLEKEAKENGKGYAPDKEHS